MELENNKRMFNQVLHEFMFVIDDDFTVHYKSGLKQVLLLTNISKVYRTDDFIKCSCYQDYISIINANSKLISETKNEADLMFDLIEFEYEVHNGLTMDDDRLRIIQSGHALHMPDDELVREMYAEAQNNASIRQWEWDVAAVNTEDRYYGSVFGSEFESEFESDFESEAEPEDELNI